MPAKRAAVERLFLLFAHLLLLQAKSFDAVATQQMRKLGVPKSAARLDLLLARRACLPRRIGLSRPQSSRAHCKTGSEDSAQGLRSNSNPRRNRARPAPHRTARTLPSQVRSIRSADKLWSHRRAYRAKPARILFASHPQLFSCRHVSNILAVVSQDLLIRKPQAKLERRF